MESDFKIKKLIPFLEKKGFVCILLIQTNLNAIADILVLHKAHKTFFIETKARDKTFDKLQKWRAKQIESKSGKETMLVNEDNFADFCVFINNL